jgi:ATP-binding cassette subfamily B protein
MRQRDQTDCGPTCLAYLCGRFGRPESVARLRQWAGTDRGGTSALGLIQAARRVGVRLEGVKGPVGEIAGLPVPFIAHVVLPSGHPHFVVVERVGPRWLGVMDPAVGAVARWPRERFASAASGVFLLAAVAPEDGEAASRRAAGPETPQRGGRIGLLGLPLRARATEGQGRDSQWRGPWVRLAGLLWPHRALVLRAVLGAVVATVLSLAFSLYVERVVDAVVPHQDVRLLTVLGFAMLFIVAVRQALGWVQGWWVLRLGQRLDVALILGYHRHLLALPATFHDGMRVGDLLARVGDAIKVRTFLSATLVGMALHPLLLVGALVALFLIHPALGQIAVVLLAVQAALAPVVSRVSRERQRELLQRGSEWQAHLVESLTHHTTVRALRWEAREERRAEQQLGRLLGASRRVVVAGLWTTVFGQGTAQVYTVATLWAGAALVLQDQLTLGQLISAYTLSAYVAGPAAALLGLSGSVQEAVAATERLFEVMDLEREGQAGRLRWEGASGGGVRLEDVTLQPAGRLPILRELTLEILPRRWTALAGASGSGKSSVLALVQGAVRPTSGRVLLGGTDLALFDGGALRDTLSVLPQRVELFSGTVLENLTGEVEAPDFPRLVAACRDAGVLEWIESQPQGFGTVLMEGGAALSGGQRQRLALARALYRPCRLLVLDEPTSALDAESEQRIVAALRRRVDAGLTLLIASHAPALLAAADTVLHLEDGRGVRDDRDARAPLAIVPTSA